MQRARNKRKMNRRGKMREREKKKVVLVEVMMKRRGKRRGREEHVFMGFWGSG